MVGEGESGRRGRTMRRSNPFFRATRTRIYKPSQQASPPEPPQQSSHPDRAATPSDFHAATPDHWPPAHEAVTVYPSGHGRDQPSGPISTSQSIQENGPPLRQVQAQAQNRNTIGDGLTAYAKALSAALSAAEHNRKRGTEEKERAGDGNGLEVSRGCSPGNKKRKLAVVDRDMSSISSIGRSSNPNFSTSFGPTGGGNDATLEMAIRGSEKVLRDGESGSEYESSEELEPRLDHQRARPEQKAALGRPASSDTATRANLNVDAKDRLAPLNWTELTMQQQQHHHHQGEAQAHGLLADFSAAHTLVAMRRARDALVAVLDRRAERPEEGWARLEGEMAEAAAWAVRAHEVLDVADEHEKEERVVDGSAECRAERARGGGDGRGGSP